MRQFYAITTIKVANEQTRLDFYGLSISLNLAKRRLAAFTINIPPQKFLLVLDFLEFLRFDRFVVFLRRDDFEKTLTLSEAFLTDKPGIESLSFEKVLSMMFW